MWIFDKAKQKELRMLKVEERMRKEHPPKPELRKIYSTTGQLKKNLRLHLEDGPILRSKGESRWVRIPKNSYPTVGYENEMKSTEIEEYNEIDIERKYTEEELDELFKEEEGDVMGYEYYNPISSKEFVDKNRMEELEQERFNFWFSLSCLILLVTVLVILSLLR